MNSKVIAICHVSGWGQESHQRIRKGKDGYSLEILCKKEKVSSLQREFKSNNGFQIHIKEIASLFSLSNNRTSAHFASDHAKRFQK